MKVSELIDIPFKNEYQNQVDELGIDDHGEIIIVERERVGSLAADDLPILLRRQLSQDNFPLDAQYELLAILWNLRRALGYQVLSNMERCLSDILHQEIAFSLSDILQDQARRLKFRDQVNETLHDPSSVGCKPSRISMEPYGSPWM